MSRSVEFGPLVLLAAGALASASACSTGVATASPEGAANVTSRSPAFVASEVLPPLATEVTFPNSSLRLRPAGARAAQAAMPAEAADASCAEGGTDCPRGRRGVIRLASASAAEGKIQSDGTVVPTLSDTLVFVQVWRSVPCAPTGMPHTSNPTTEGEDVCDVVRLVDARTGAGYGTTITNDQQTAAAARALTTS